MPQNFELKLNPSRPRRGNAQRINMCDPVMMIMASSVLQRHSKMTQHEIDSGRRQYK